MTRRTLLSLTLATLLAPAAPAAAADYCVARPACVSAGGIDAGSSSGAVQDALDAAKATAAADSVLIGPGTFDAVADDGYDYLGGSPLEIAGAGAAETIFTMSASGVADFIVDLDGSGSGTTRIHDVGIRLGPGYGGNAIALASASAERIAITSGPATDGNQGARLLTDAVLRDSSIDVDGAAPRGILVGSLVGGDYRVERVTVDSEGDGVVAGPKPGSTLTLAQVAVHAARTALAVERATTIAGSSLFAGGAPARVLADGEDTTLVADHVTFAGGGATGLAVTGRANRTAGAVVRNSILTGAGRPFTRTGDGGTANLTTDHVSHGSVAPGDESGPGDLLLQGSLPAAGAFADAAYRLPAGSPLIDAGLPPTIDEPARDLDGNPRVADGNGDCTAASDIGAYERPARTCGDTPPAPPPPPPPGAGQPQPDTAAPVVSRLRVRRHGARLTLELSEAATVRVGVQKRARGAWRTVKTIRRAAPAGTLKLELPKRGSGRRRVAVVAVDAAGNRSAPARKRYKRAAAAH